MEERCLNAFLELTFIIFEARIGLREEKEDGSDVCQYHESHEEVGEIPDEREVSLRAPEDHDSDAETEKIERPFLFCQVADIDLPIVVVTDEGGEGEEEDQDGDGFRSHRAKVLGKIPLDELDAGETGRSIVACQEDDECGSRADEERIDIDTEGLDETLHSRVTGVCGGCRIRYRAFAGLVREEAALEACQDGSAHAAAKDCLEVKSIAENDAKDPGHFCDVEKHDAKRDQDVNAGHDRDHPFRDAGDTAHAAADDSHSENSDDTADEHAVKSQRGGKCECDGIRLDGVVDHAIGDRDQNGKNRCPQTMPETIFQVVSRAAAESGAVFARDFIDLSERTFYEACR